MAEVRFITHKGEEILYVDWSDSNSEEVLSLIKEARALIDARLKGSILTLTNVTNVNLDPDAIRAVQLFTRDNKDYVAAAALVGITEIQKIILEGVAKFSERNFKVFKALDEAKDWLVAQERRLNL
ncbi:MAG: hypothetical protein GY858_06820 [Candidatus Omnitrophica bacterium]|nr:hypothetical protein [Candidatus Omnitrophota bacterium]